MYALRVERCNARLAPCAEAELEQARINLEQAQAEWKTAQEQHKSGTVPSSDYNMANFKQKTAKASVAAPAEAVLVQNKAARRQVAN